MQLLVTDVGLRQGSFANKGGGEAVGVAVRASCLGFRTIIPSHSSSSDRQLFFLLTLPSLCKSSLELFIDTKPHNSSLKVAVVNFDFRRTVGNGRRPRHASLPGH